MKPIAYCLLLIALLGRPALSDVNYTYDAAGRLIKVDYGNGTVITYTYDPAGNLLSRLVLSSRPSLTISKTHSGNFTGGQTARYTVTVTNAQGAGSTSGTVTVTETPPTGLSLVSMQGTGWNCMDAVCTRSDVLTAGLSYPPITVTVAVAANATSPQLNQVAVSGGGSASGNATDSTVVTAVATQTSTGFVFNRSNGTYTGTFTITNTSSSSLNGPFTLVLENLPAGVTAANNTGTYRGNPTWTAGAGSLSPGASTTIAVAFRKTSPSLVISYLALIFSGSF
jgi:uncharacterized repeat protein (TIGR01451 family)